MGRSSSDFEFWTGTDIEEAANFAASLEHNRPKGYEYAGYEFTFLVNGLDEWNEDGECIYAENLIWPHYKEALQRLETAAREREKAEAEEQARRKAKQKEQRQKQKEKEERALYEQLRQKYD